MFIVVKLKKIVLENLIRDNFEVFITSQSTRRAGYFRVSLKKMDKR